MAPNEDQLAVLHRLQSEGQLTAAEYAHLAAGLTTSRPASDREVEAEEPGRVEPGPVTSPGPEPERHRPDPYVSEPADTTGPVEAAADDEETPGDDGAPAFLLPPPRLRSDLSTSYLTMIGLAGMAILLAATTGLLSWPLAISIVLILVTTLIEGWKPVTIVGTVVVLVTAAVGILTSEGPPPADQGITRSTEASPEATAAIPGSLGIHMDEVTDAWNTIEGEPRITRGLTRHNETGQYDTFIYRFGEWGRLAGAYDPDTETLYALLAAGWLSEAATSQLYLRLCFMVAPYSQECVDSYLDSGLSGMSLEELEAPFQSEWRVGEHTWRLEIEESLLTIRVFGADAA